MGYKILRSMKWILPAIILGAGLWLAAPEEVQAQTCICPNEDPAFERVQKGFHRMRDFVAGDLFEEALLPNLQLMSESLVAGGIHQSLIIGTFFDAKQQLETLRDFESLKFEAHKDYQPNEGFCTIGTSARSLAASDALGRLNQLTLNSYFIDRLTGKAGTAGAGGSTDDIRARWEQFTNQYCDPQDKNWGGVGEKSDGLEKACGTGASDPKRVNRDIDFTRFVEMSRTLNVDFTDNVLQPDEEDIMAMGNNLFSHKLPARNLEFLNNPDGGHQYIKLRSVMAKQNVARGSFDALVGLKSSGHNGPDSDANSFAYLGAALRNLGMTNDDIVDVLGEKPSYFAQLEVLSKRLYQSPNFIAALYDSPSNISRKKAALNAIELLVDRAIYESELRQEMVLSVLLATDLNKNFVGAATRSVAGK